MIYIGVGANLAGNYDSPSAAVLAVPQAMQARDIRVVAMSRLYQTPPMGPADQPPYINAALAVETDHAPADLLAHLHEIEAAFGRKRRERWQARVLDLDLLDYDGQQNAAQPILPHTGIAERAFVLVPLYDIAPDWQHPISGQNITALLAAFTAEELAEIVPLSA